MIETKETTRKNYPFEELVDVKVLQGFTDALYSAFGLPSAIITTKGEVLTGSGWQKICTDFHRQNPESEKDCIESDTCLTRMIEEGKQYCIYKCPRGLVDSSSPVIVDGTHLANVFTGQFFSSPPTNETESFFRKQAEIYGFDEKSYMEAYNDIPVFPEGKHNQMLDVLVSIAAILSESGLARKRELEKVEQVKESEEKFSAITEQSTAGITVSTHEGNYVLVNPAFCKMVGYTEEELLQLTVFDMKKDKTEAAREGFRKSKSNKDGAVVEVVLQRKDKSTFTSEVIGKPIKIGDKSLVLGIVNDITETKRLQELESRAQRLETAGTIAGQVAHDFNNLLAPIMAYPEFIREGLPEDHSTIEYLDQIEKAARKIADINQQLLTLGRRGHYNQDVLNLNTIVDQAIKDMPRLGNNVTRETNLDPDLMNILGGGSQIHRVITNLLCNAIDALQDIGHINIKTENYYADDVSGTYGHVPKGEYVKLTISDTGCGISDDIVQKILDPFFTTKTTDQKRGSGLGLSVVDAVVKDHDGYLDLKTQPGKGTSFYLYFPTTRRSSDKDHSDMTIGGNETILVIDDDDIQRDVSTQLLRRLGYEVNSVESGEKAIEYLRKNPHDLVILDMIMPGGIDGAETYKQILEISPNQKAIIVSDFSESDKVKEAQDLGAGAFVKKPLTKIAIAAAVRAELDRKEKVVTSRA